MPKRAHSEIESNSHKHATPSSTVRICVGSYEHVLYGVDASLLSDKRGKLSVAFNPVYMFEAHTAQIRTCAIGGRYLASGGVDEILKLYDLRRRKDLGSLLSHDGTITSIKFPSQDVNPSHMLSADANNRIIIWRVRDWTPQIQLTTRHGVVNDLSIHPSGKICLSVGSDRNVRLWNLVTGKKAAAFKLGRDEPRKVAWNTAGDGYAILYDRFIGIYDMSATLKHKFESDKSKFHAMSWYSPPTSGTSPTGQDELLVATLDNGTIQILRPSTGEVVQVIKGHETRIKAVSTQLVVPDGRGGAEPVLLIVTGSTDGIIKLWATSSPAGHTSDQQYVEIGSYNCGDCRITSLATCDASVEDLEMVVKRRVDIKQEVLSGDETGKSGGEEVGTEDGQDNEDEDENEEFAGFDE